MRLLCTGPRSLAICLLIWAATDSFWFEDVEWGVENYGVDPDIPVDFPPHAHVAGE